MIRNNKKILSAVLLFFFLLLPKHVISKVSQPFFSVPLKDVAGYIIGFRPVSGFEQMLILSGKSLKLISKDAKTVAEFPFDVNEIPLALDILGDNGNGFFEIAVTSVVAGRPSSYVLGLTPFPVVGGKIGFVVVLKDVPYFLRVVNKDGQNILLGQQGTSEVPFSGAVHELERNGPRLRKGTKLDLPKRVGIYEFSLTSDPLKVWVRDRDGVLERFESNGHKWKKVVRSPERYRGNVDCFMSTVSEPIVENVVEDICIPTSPIIIETTVAGQSGMGELVVLDSHEYLLGGAILRPAMPRKAFIHVLSYDDTNGLEECHKFGPYQGWIGDFIVLGSTPESKNFGLGSLMIGKNSDDKYVGGSRMEELSLDIGCQPH